MIQAKTPIVDNQQVSNKDAKFFAAENKIVPIRRITHESITQIEDFREEQIIPEQKVQAIIREKKRSNPFSKFFSKTLKYIDKLEDFIEIIQRLQLASITQKKILLQSEKTDQALRTYQSKRIVKDIKKSEEEQEQESINLKDNPELGSMLAAALGLGAAAALIPSGGVEIYGDVVGEGEFGVDMGGALTQVSPAWIPFPKGTAGLTFTSGFGYQLRRGYEHGGIDIAGPVGTPIITPISGIVSAAGWNDGGYGNWVIVKSGSTEMIFAHMYQTPPVRAGQQIQAGTVVGGIGSTGRSTGPHLHWTIQVNGEKVDPALWTKSNPPSTSTAGARSDDRPPLDNESEGGINQSRKIMVGEAGKEFVVPMSQMPMFIQGMLEEKIKCLNPYYQGTTAANAGFETSSGPDQTKFADDGIVNDYKNSNYSIADKKLKQLFPMTKDSHIAGAMGNFEIEASGPAQTKFADGGIVINYKNPNYSIAAKKLKQLFPMAKDYHIAGAMGNFEIEAPGLIPTTQQAGGPGYGIAQWTKTQRWGGTDSPLYYSALKFGGPSIATSLTKQLEFVKFELTDPRAADNIRGGHQKPSPLQKWLATKDVVSAAETFMNVYEQPGTPHWDRRKAAAISFNNNMKKLLSIVAPPKPKPKDKNIFEKIMEIIMPPPKKTASLDNVENQMQISKDYQKQFSFENSTNEIIALYKPTVYYSEAS